MSVRRLTASFSTNGGSYYTSFFSFATPSSIVAAGSNNSNDDNNKQQQHHQEEHHRNQQQMGLPNSYSSHVASLNQSVGSPRKDHARTTVSQFAVRVPPLGSHIPGRLFGRGSSDWQFSSATSCCNNASALQRVRGTLTAGTLSTQRRHGSIVTLSSMLYHEGRQLRFKDGETTTQGKEKNPIDLVLKQFTAQSVCTVPPSKDDGILVLNDGKIDLLCIDWVEAAELLSRLERKDADELSSSKPRFGAEEKGTVSHETVRKLFAAIATYLEEPRTMVASGGETTELSTTKGNITSNNNGHHCRSLKRLVLDISNEDALMGVTLLFRSAIVLEEEYIRARNNRSSAAERMSCSLLKNLEDLDLTIFTSALGSTHQRQHQQSSDSTKAEKREGKEADNALVTLFELIRVATTLTENVEDAALKRLKISFINDTMGTITSSGASGFVMCDPEVDALSNLLIHSTQLESLVLSGCVYHSQLPKTSRDNLRLALSHCVGRRAVGEQQYQQTIEPRTTLQVFKYEYSDAVCAPHLFMRALGRGLMNVSELSFEGAKKDFGDMSAMYLGEQLKECVESTVPTGRDGGHSATLRNLRFYALRSLNLSHCGLSEYGVQKISEGLASSEREDNGGVVLETLKLDNNRLTGESIFFLASVAPGLKSLSLRYGKFSSGENFSALLAALEQASELSVLVFNNNTIGNEGVKNVASRFRHWPHLKVLDLTRCRFTSRGLYYLSEKLSLLESLECLKLNRNDFRLESSVGLKSADDANGTLVGSWNPFVQKAGPSEDDVTISLVAAEHHRRKTSTTKELGQNDLPPETPFRAFSDALAAVAGTLKVLDMSDALLSDRVLTEFSPGLMCLRQLQVLHMGGNRIGCDGGVQSLCRALRCVSDTLEELVLDGNTGIGNVGGTMLMDGGDVAAASEPENSEEIPLNGVSSSPIGGLSKLRKLSLSNCNLGIHAIEALTDIIPNLTSLEELDLSYNNFGNPVSFSTEDSHETSHDTQHAITTEAIAKLLKVSEAVPNLKRIMLMRTRTTSSAAAIMTAMGQGDKGQPLPEEKVSGLMGGLAVPSMEPSGAEGTVSQAQNVLSNRHLASLEPETANWLRDKEATKLVVAEAQRDRVWKEAAGPFISLLL